MAILRDPQLHLVFGVTLMIVLGVSSVIPVLPQLMAGLAISPAQVGLIMSVFTLPGIFMAPLVGILADRHGRKAVLVPSLVLFGCLGLACSLAPDYETLLALRLLQGVGAAPLGILAYTLIGDLYTGRDLAVAMGYNSAVLSVGTALYPVLGGLLGFLGWRPPFALSLAALPLAWAVARRLDVARPAQTQPAMTYLRQALAGMGRTPVLGVFGVTLGAFLLLYGPLVTFYPILLHDTQNASALQIGLVIAAASFFSAGAATQMGRLAPHFGEAGLIRAGAVCYMVCFALAPLMDRLWWHLLPLAFFGLAQGLTIPTVATLLSRLAAPEHRGGYMAMNGTLLRLGQTVGPLFFAGIHGLLGLSAVFWCGAVLAVAMLLSSAVTIRSSEINS